METRRTCKSIESEIGKFRQQIQREEPQAAEMEAVAREYTDKVELYQRTMENIRSNKKSLRVCLTYSQRCTDTRGVFGHAVS